MAEGRAWHKGLERYFTSPANFILDAIEEFEDDKNEILDLDEDEFFKARERLDKNLSLFHEEFMKSDRDWKDNLYVEIKVSGTESPIEGGLPFTAQMDLITKDGNPVDHKYVGMYSTNNGYEHYVQAWFYYWATFNLTGKYPKIFTLSEVIYPSDIRSTHSSLGQKYSPQCLHLIFIILILKDIVKLMTIILLI